jgi:hypothetical protein
VLDWYDSHLLLKSQIVVFLIKAALLLARSVCADCAPTTLAFCPMEPLSSRALVVKLGPLGTSY